MADEKTYPASIFINTPHNPEYHSPTPGEITLMAGNPNLNAGVLDNALCSQIKECGFNTIGASIGAGNISESLQNCYNNGLSLFLGNNTVNVLPYAENFINTYKDRNGLGGWFLNNLVNANQILSTESEKFPDGREQVPFSTTYKYLTQVDPNHPVFVGINADWEKDRTNGNLPVPFPSLLAAFEENFQPNLWVWNYVPQLYTNPLETLNYNRWVIFYKNLQYFAYISRYTANPMWTFCFCESFNNYYGYNVARPTLELLRQIVFSSLAYGAQGIFFSNYRQNPDNGNLTFNYAPIDREGNKTTTWDYVRIINEEVKRFNEVFCGCELIDCRYTNSASAFNVLKKMDHAMGPLVSVEGSNPQVLVSHINNNGQDYIVIVSTSLMNDLSGKGETIILNFSQYYTVTEITNKGKILDTSTNIYKKVEVNLNRGDYVIFKWS